MKKENVATVVERLLTPVVEEMGYRLWDVVFHKVGADPTLTITIDNDEGITIEDCERVHRAIDPLLDEADPIEVAYRLEVSSPGVERTLTRDEHFEYCLGVEVEVKLFKAFNGMKVIRGILNDAFEDRFVIVCGEDAFEIEKKAAAKVNTVFNWDD